MSTILEAISLDGDPIGYDAYDTRPVDYLGVQEGYVRCAEDYQRLHNLKQIKKYFQCISIIQSVI